MSKICSKCGKQNEDSSKYCFNCASSFDENIEIKNEGIKERKSEAVNFGSMINNLNDDKIEKQINPVSLNFDILNDNQGLSSNINNLNNEVNNTVSQEIDTNNVILESNIINNNVNNTSSDNNGQSIDLNKQFNMSNILNDNQGLSSNINNLNNEVNNTVSQEIDTNNVIPKGNIVNNTSSDNNGQSIDQNDQYDKDFYGNDLKPKNKKNIIIIVILLLLIIGLGIGIFFLSKPKTMVTLSLNKYLSKLEKNIINDYDSITSEFDLSLVLDDKSGVLADYVNILNNIKVNGKIEVDNDKQIINYDFGSTYKDKELLKGNVYSENNNIYVKLDGVYDNYLFLDKLGENKKITQEDYNNIYTVVKEALVNSMKEEYFTKTNEKITLNNEKVNTNKISLKINKSNYSDIVRSIISDLKNNKKFIDSYKNITGEDVIQYLDQYESINVTYVEEMEINFYLKNITNDLLKIEIKQSEGTSVVELIFNKDLLEINFKEKDVEEEIINIKITYTDDLLVISLDSNVFSLSINLKLKVDYNKTVMNKDITNSVDINDLSDDELNKIQLEIAKKEGIIEIIADMDKFQNNNVFNNYNNNEFTIDDNF